MNWRTFAAALVAVVASLLSIDSQAQTLYAAVGANGAPGQLYRVNGTTAAATLVGPIRIGATPISITGLAIHPATGVLYGIVSNGSPSNARALVTINPATGAATLVGNAGIPISDIAFSAAGTLYGWARGTNTLATINLATGVATSLGPSGLAAFAGGGGLAVANGVGFVSATSATGTLDTVNLTTGVGTTGPAMTGATFNDAMNAMTFTPGGTLFAVNSNNNGPANTVLVTINTTTGAVTNIGALPDDIDAIVFAASPVAAPTMSEWMLVLMGLLLGMTGFAALRARGR
jgi:hypothetical protein